ncbi:ATP-dependent protease LonB [Candidatus Poseidoniales archaeon]|nr:MAG: Lon-B peptidase, ATP-dependent (S16 family) [uncultured Candidatus Poseidoniales archaeon]MDA7740272.1 ATP-dependent protease LonB [Euryarchaeota archaeon]MDA8616344.1 ATP-dependent protease LonB [Candidatus Poseidoniales archaeon]MDA8748248.1 ATP-dependent protease LonB [Candidatus Poseidoniales archaeon]
MTEEIVEDEAPLTAAEDGADSIENSAPLADDTQVTVWAPEPSAGGDDIIAESVEQWIQTVNFESTEDVPIPDRLVDQVIGQEAGSIVIKKAAEQRRHMLMIGDPGTGKSMLARSMTDLLPKDALEDLLVYPNEDDENEPRVRSVPAGRGDRIVKLQKESMRTQRERSQKMLLIAFAAVGFLILIATLQSGDIITLLFGGFLLMFGYMFIRGRLSSGDESRIPKVLVKHDSSELPPFVDATATLSGSLLGDVRHDPFQSGGMETPAHDRVEPGAIHRAHKGVLYIDEVNLLRLEEQQALLTAMQERAFPISGRSERSSGALTKTEPVPCDFILIAAGNLDAIQGMHPALRSRIRGYGYEVYVNSEMPDTARNRRRLIRFIAQEVRRDMGTSREIPHFEKSAVAIILREAQRRAGRRGKLSLRLRELGGLVRIAGDLAMEEGAPLTTAAHVLGARNIAKPLEQQVADRMIERRLDYALVVNSGERIGRVNGLAVLGANSGLSDFSGIMLPVEALVTPSQGGGGKIHATGGLSDLAKESVTNVSAVIKKLTGKDISDYDIHIQFVDTHGVDGDSASITIATAIISALESIPIRQDLAMTGSLSVRGEVLPIGGVTAKIEAAARSGIKAVIIPRANEQDVLLDTKYESMIEVIPVDTLDEVMEYALIKHAEKAGLVERLGAVIDRLTPVTGSVPSA